MARDVGRRVQQWVTWLDHHARSRVPCLATCIGIAGVLTLITTAPAAAVIPQASLDVRPPAVNAAPGQDIARLRTRTSQTFAAEGGSYELRVSRKPVNYRDSGGRWRPIDNTLMVDRATLRNRANSYELALPRTLGSRAVRVRTGDAWIEFEPRGTGFPKAAVAGARASFREAWPGVELRYTAMPEQVKEVLIVRDLAAVRNFAFNVRLPLGYDLARRPDGTVVVRDMAGSLRMRISRTTMVDASGAMTLTRSELHRTDGGWIFEIVPDRAWLTDPARTWPVTIDPTVAPSIALACNIWSEVPGQEDSCSSGLTVGENCPDACQWARALVRFDVSDALPPGAVVEFAGLDLRASEPTPVVDAYQMTANWTQDVDWSTRDGVTPWSGSSSFPWGGGDGDYDPTPISDATGLVRRWVSGEDPNYGVLIKAEETNVWNTFTSVDPVLTVQYAPTDDPDGLQGRAAAWYAAVLGVTVEEAMRRLRIQDRLANLADELEQAIEPSDFGGGWFDENDGGRAKIGIESNLPSPPSSKFEDARELLEDHDLLDDVDFVSVQSSVVDLEDAVEDLAITLDSLLDSDKIALVILPQANAVELTKANSLTAGEESDVAAAVAAADVTVTVQTVNSATIGVSDDACHEVATQLQCDAPFRGGVGVRPLGDAACTGGFYATGRAGEPTAGKHYILTAGHCLDGEAGSTWEVLDSDGDEYVLGTSADFENGPRDAGLIEIASGSVWKETNPPTSLFVDESDENGIETERDESYDIKRVRRTPRAFGIHVVCHTSTVRLPDADNRHTQCGRVGGFGGRFRGKRDLARVTFCGTGGASGGPVYKNHNAYGIWVGSRRVIGCAWGYYQGARGAEDRLEVDIATTD